MPDHNIPPVFDGSSEILILGSFPSVRSRETAFFYGHPQNRFWRVTAAVFGCAVPETVDEKRDMLLRSGAALWDVIASCDINGSDDASISGAVPNDIGLILRSAPIERIYTNGGKADELYRRFILPETGIESVRLPSTSPANAAWSFDRLLERWRQISTRASRTARSL